MSQGLTIPFDILENIIDILSADDDQHFTFLKPCSLICRSLLHCCRKHLFKIITVDCEEDSSGQWPAFFSQIPSLCWLISSTPQIAGYVRVLALGISSHSEYYAAYPEFPGVLQKLNHIQSLTLKILRGERYSVFDAVNWLHIPSAIQDSMIFLMQLETLTSLTLRALYFPISLAPMGINLHELHIYQVTSVEGDNVATGLKRVQPTRLYRYTMGYDAADTTRLLLDAKQSNNRHIFDFSRLCTLFVACRFPTEVDVARDILHRTAHLTTIDLTGAVALPSVAIDPGIDIPFFLVDNPVSLTPIFGGLLSSIKTLKTITLRRSNYGTLPNIVPLAGLSYGLEAMSSLPNVLEELILSERLLVDDLHISGCEMGRVDAALGAHNRWPFLKRISIEFKTAVRMHASSDSTDDVTVNEVETTYLRQEQFPILSSNQSILFDVVVNNS